MRSFVTQVYRDNPKSLLNYKQLAARTRSNTDAVDKQILSSGARGDGEGRAWSKRPHAASSVG